MIIKVTLRVTWNQQKRPSQGVVESLQVWQRTGEPGFAVKEVKNLTLDEILVQRANGKVTRLENPAINQFHAVSVKNDQ